MEIRVEPGTEVIKTSAYVITENTDIYIPISVKRIETFALNGSFSAGRGIITIYYEGTMEEWKAIVKGGIYHVVREDYYGYYYHNSDRYEEYDEYRPYFHTDLFHEPVVHCKDGIIEDNIDNDEKVFKASMK